MSSTDAQWARPEPLLPDRSPRRNGRWRDHRQVLDAIAFKYRTGTPWVDLPKRFGSWKGVHNRLRTWAAEGTFERVFTALLAQTDTAGDMDWGVAVDSSSSALISTRPEPSKGAPGGERTIMPLDGLSAA
ncbi:transposase [Streptomyces mutomycini]|uniref:transposase n=1 Tax=Streptomyces mutomycini TaxID=284036 RepID=UPI0033C143DA